MYLSRCYPLILNRRGGPWPTLIEIGIGFQEAKIQSKMVTLLLGILLSLTLDESSTVESRKKKINQLLSTSWGELHNTDTGCCFSEPVRHQKSEQPWPWRKLEIVKWVGKAESPERQQRQGNRVWVNESTGRPGVLHCVVLTSCQRISAQWFSAWLRGPWALRALLAVKPELCAWLDRVTIVKNAAKVQWLHSVRFTFTLSLLPTYPHRTKQKHCVSFGAFHQINVQYRKYKHRGFQM